MEVHAATCDIVVEVAAPGTRDRLADTPYSSVGSAKKADSPRALSSTLAEAAAAALSSAPPSTHDTFGESDDGDHKSLGKPPPVESS
jgi:hypothetical protein